MASPPIRRCAIYTRKSSEEGLEQEYQFPRRAAGRRKKPSSAPRSTRGGNRSKDAYDDGGISGGHLERPGLQRLLKDVESGKIDVVVVYKVDRFVEIARGLRPAHAVV